MDQTLLLLLVVALVMFFLHRGHGDMGGCGKHTEGEGGERGAVSAHHQRGFSHALLMVLACVLPLFLFFFLASSGVALSPIFFWLFLLLCMGSMFFLMRGGCDEEAEEGEEPEAIRLAPSPREEAALIERVRDVFEVRFERRLPESIVLEGRLLEEPRRAYERLQTRFAGTGVRPLLQEGDEGRPIVALLPEQQAPPPSSRPSLHFALFLLTLATTAWAGARHQGIDLLEEPERWTAGLPYSLGLLLILGVHELGHYVAARAHGMKVSLPYFIPVPFGLGTFGAFIQMRSTPQNRRVLFDVGVAGPLAGLAVALPALYFGLQQSQLLPGEAAALHGGTSVGSSMLLAILSRYAMGETAGAGHLLALHPLAFAGWLGLFITALNLLPIGQLDGGHIAHALFGRKKGDTIGMVALFGLFLLGIFTWSGLLTWAIIIFFIAGAKSAPPLEDIAPLDNWRTAIGAFAFIVLFLILFPVPHALYGSMGIHCPYV